MLERREDDIHIPNTVVEREAADDDRVNVACKQQAAEFRICDKCKRPYLLSGVCDALALSQKPEYESVSLSVPLSMTTSVSPHTRAGWKSAPRESWTQCTGQRTCVTPDRNTML
jgi:hypothetical protein